MKKIILTTMFAIALGTSALAPSHAQMSGKTPDMKGMKGMKSGGCPMMGMMTMMGGGEMRGSMMGKHGKMGAMVTERLTHLKAELKITDAQTDAWTGYADAVNARVETMKGMRQTMMSAMQSGSAVERMDARIGGMEAMVETMKAVMPAIGTLYAVLTDEQKKVADQLIGKDCGAM